LALSQNLISFPPSLLDLSSDVVSNFVEVDSNGIISAFKGPMIHVFNKNEYVVKTTPYAAQIQVRESEREREREREREKGEERREK
jgi:hypothetical protein